MSIIRYPWIVTPVRIASVVVLAPGESTHLPPFRMVGRREFYGTMTVFATNGEFVQFTVEQSSDLVNWTPVPSYQSTIGGPFPRSASIPDVDVPMDPIGAPYARIGIAPGEDGSTTVLSLVVTLVTDPAHRNQYLSL